MLLFGQVLSAAHGDDVAVLRNEGAELFVDAAQFSAGSDESKDVLGFSNDVKGAGNAGGCCFDGFLN